MKYKKGVNRSAEIYLLNTRDSISYGVHINIGIVAGDMWGCGYIRSMFHGKDFTNLKRGIIVEWKARYHMWDDSGYFVVGMGCDE